MAIILLVNYSLGPPDVSEVFPEFFLLILLFRIPGK